MRNKIIDLKCYPNPSTGVSTIELPSSFNGANINLRVMDIKGSITPVEFELNHLKLELNTHHMNPGSYTVEIITDLGEVARIALQVK